MLEEKVGAASVRLPDHHPGFMSGASLHLWIKPSGEAYEALARVIRRFSLELGCPAFEPHVTLLGHVGGTEEEVVQCSKKLASQIGVFEITLTEASYREEYFRCLFMGVAETKDVMNANARAAQAFKNTQAKYEPHVSLVYGHLSEASKKLIIQKLPGDVHTHFEARAITVVRADSPDPRDWHEIGDFCFGG